MERPPAQARQRVAELRGRPGRRCRPSSVLRIPDEGEAEVGEVHPNLVGPTGLEPHRQLGMGTEAGRHPIMRDRVPSPPRNDRHPGPVSPVPADGSVDRATRDHASANEREVLAPDRTRRPLVDERMMGREGPGHDEESARILVEAVHHPGPRDGREGRIVMEERVDERPVVPAGARMHDHAGRLVDHDDGVVLVADVETDGLGFVPAMGGLVAGRRQHDPLARLQRVPGAAGPVPGQGMALADPAGKACPRVLRRKGGKNDVEALAVPAVGYREPGWRFSYPIAHESPCGISSRRRTSRGRVYRRDRGGGSHPGLDGAQIVP